MNYNARISVIDITDDSGPVSYPVTLPEMKAYMRISDWEDSDDSPSTFLSEFTDDDILITEMIQAATELIEEKAEISITPHTKQAVLRNRCNMQMIPYGPIIGVDSISNSSGDLIPTTSYTLVGDDPKYIKCPLGDDITVIYTTGYGDTITGPLPKAIKIDIMRLVAYMYENRGDYDKIDRFAYQLSSRYSRNTGIV